MLLFGVALLVIGVAIQNRGARMLSFVFVLGAVLKVFLWDAAGLDGLWRVLSFFGMGLCLLAISWLYARFVFGLGIGRKDEPPRCRPLLRRRRSRDRRRARAASRARGPSGSPGARRR